MREEEMDMRENAPAARDAASGESAGAGHDRHDLPTDFERLAALAISRRGFLRGGAAFGAAAFVLGAGGMAAPGARAATAGLEFTPVAANGLDTITLPEGFGWQVVARWGDPLWSDGAPFDHATRGTAASQERAFGDNCDGMALFAHEGRSVLAVNNEYTNLGIAFANRASGRPESEDDVRKCKAAHGVSVFEIAQEGGAWGIVLDSPYNRRITPDTPMEITGPARGHELLKTAADPDGTTALGTWNNCGNGRTPWGTYLACEENFNGYFSSSDPDFALPEGYKRYGIKAEDRGYAWAMADERFDVSRHPNEPHRAGYVVEIDPLDPASTPKKRTALGRFKHENAALTLAADGRVVVYLGDDERGEFLYRFVSDGAYSEGGDNADLLASGTLSVARFADDGGGEWVALTPEATGMASARRDLHPHAPGGVGGRAPRPWTGRSGSPPTRTRPRPIAASPTTRTAASSPTRAAMPRRWAAPTRARRTTTARSSAGGRRMATTRPLPSPGTSTSSPATRPCMRTRMRALTT